MLIPRTIPKKGAHPLPLDHQALFTQGLERIRSLAGAVWTDHNIHDPGITTLELLAYALTDLAYRASYPIEDLLAGAANPDPHLQALFTAREILTSRPLTHNDYRKLLIDLEGVKNAWIRPATETYFADTIKGELLREAPPGLTGIVPVELRGLHTVLIEFMDEVRSNAARNRILQNARRTLHDNRNLCEDFVDFAEVATQPFIVCAELDLEPDANIARVEAELLFQVQEYLSPPVHQYTLAQMLGLEQRDGSPYTSDQIFNGPPLQHGFIMDDELEAAELRTEVRLSDVISIIMDLEGVRAVRDIVINPVGTDPLENKWLVQVEPGRKPLLDRASSRIVHYKRNLPFRARTAEVDAIWTELAGMARAQVETPVAADFEVPRGHARAADSYHSFQHDYPAVYGLGESGLPGLRTPERQVQAYQLMAYLLFFDQIMANYFAQLSHVADLFSIDPLVDFTYFHQLVGDEDSVIRENIYRATDLETGLSSALESRQVRVARRNRFLDHLIARFAERFHDFAAIMNSEFAAEPQSMIRYKCDFLRNYPTVSAERSRAYNYTLREDGDLWNSDNISGLERRLASLLGIRNPQRRNLGEIAYDLYTEVDSTPGDEFRWRVRDKDTGKIVLSGTTNYLTEQDASTEMGRAISFATTGAGYQRREAEDGRHYFNIVDDTGEVIGWRNEFFRTPEARDAAISALIEYLRSHYSDEGMYLIESILLRPQQASDPFLPICADPNCTDCADADPYSYRIHIVLPAFAGRFRDMEFRRWCEQVIREETPAHILPRICWIGRDDMAELERTYREWISLKSGRERARRAQRLSSFIHSLFAVRNVYPVQSLRECDAPEGEEKFILGQTALGSAQ
ncbi:MAG TPA: hypothetical protein VFO52_07695 [Longimicrobiales bacterium]|nr:hypothetical protein [Longimicrobiales bacterium]